MAKTSTKKAAPRKPAAPEGDHTHLASPQEEDKMRAAAVKPSAVKEAAKTGAKDPIAKFGDPDADPAELSIRRANFG